MFFDGTDFNIDLSFLDVDNSYNNYNLDFQKQYKNSKYFFPEEGFLKGNMFAKEYKPYKNYKEPKLKVTNEKEELMYKLMAYNFAFNDLNLYLDIYPEDKEALELFKKYVLEYKKIKKEYAIKYGPILLEQAKYDNYEWINNPWPWDRFGGNMYV